MSSMVPTCRSTIARTIGGVIGVAALCAGVLPAHRAAKVDPMKALRYE